MKPTVNRSNNKKPGRVGTENTSRHGDELSLWAIFERPDDEHVSPRIVDRSFEALTPEHPDLQQAMAHHGLRWLVLPDA